MECDVAPGAINSGKKKKNSELHGSTASLALSTVTSRSINLEDGTFPQASPDSIATFGWSIEEDWNNILRDSDMLGLEIPLGHQGTHPIPYPFNDEHIALENSISPLALGDLSGPSLFEHRNFSRPNQGPLVSLAMRILRSYPFMMLQKTALPPFISPLQSSWVGTGVGPPQQVS